MKLFIRDEIQGGERPFGSVRVGRSISPQVAPRVAPRVDRGSLPSDQVIRSIRLPPLDGFPNATFLILPVANSCSYAFAKK